MALSWVASDGLAVIPAHRWVLRQEDTKNRSNTDSLENLVGNKSVFKSTKMPWITYYYNEIDGAIVIDKEILPALVYWKSLNTGKF